MCLSVFTKYINMNVCKHGVDVDLAVHRDLFIYLFITRLLSVIYIHIYIYIYSCVCRSILRLYKLTLARGSGMENIFIQGMFFFVLLQEIKILIYMYQTSMLSGITSCVFRHKI